MNKNTLKKMGYGIQVSEGTPMPLAIPEEPVPFADESPPKPLRCVVCGELLLADLEGEGKTLTKITVHCPKKCRDALVYTL